MASVTARVSTASTANATSYTSGSFTPAAGEILVAFVLSTGSTDPGAMSDTQSLGFALAGSATKNSGADTLSIFVSQKAAAASSMTVTFKCPQVAASGSVIFVAGISGLTRVGPAILRQLATLSDQAVSTPAVSFASSVLTGNPTLGFVGNATNPAGLTAPTNWTQQGDTGYATPTTGADYVSRDSGFTGTTITWGSSSSAWGGIIIEVDTSAPVTQNIWPNVDSTHPAVLQTMMTNTPNEAVNGIQLHFPNLTGAGNLLILAMFRDANVTITSIVNDAGGTWTQGPSVAGPDEMIDVWYLVNCPANVSKVTVTYSATLSTQHFSFCHLVEVSGIATSSAVDGTATSSSSSVGVIQPGAITTTQAGDFVFNFVAGNNAFPQNETPLSGITPDNSSVLLLANNTYQLASQFTVQGSAGSINPAMYHDDPEAREHTWLSAAIAFKASSGAGTQPAAGIRLVRVMTYNNTVGTTAQLQFPTSGNLTLFTSTNASNTFPITSISDSNGDTWNQISQPVPTLDPQYYYAQNITPNQNNHIKWTQTGTAPFVLFWDIAGATATPLDTSTEANGNQTNAGDDITSAPVYTPLTSPTLIVCVCEFGQGPPNSSTLSGAIFDSVFATGMTDGDNFSSGDSNQHYYSSNTSSLNFGTHMSNAFATSWHALAAGWKAAPTGSQDIITRQDQFQINIG